MLNSNGMKINSNLIKSKISIFAKKKHLKFVILFGSVALSKGKDNSDVDIAILRTDYLPLKYKEYSKMLDFFSGLFKNYEKCDLVDLAQANILFKYEITSEGQLLYGDKAEFLEYKILSFKEYVDSKSLLDLEKIIIFKRQKKLGSFLKYAQKGSYTKKNLSDSR